MAPAAIFSAVNTVDAAMASAGENEGSMSWSTDAIGGIQVSVLEMIEDIIANDSTGNLPLADSPESMTWLQRST